MPAQIPTLNGVQVQRAPIGGAPRSTEGDRALYQGKSAQASAISDIGGTLGNYAILTQNVQNDADEVRGELAMRKAALDLQNDLESDPNPTTWKGKAEKRVDEARATVFSSGQDGRMISEPVRLRLKERFDQWSMATTVGVRNQAVEQQKKENNAVFVEAQAVEVAAGNLAGAEHYVEMRRKLGLISDQRATMELQNVAHGVDGQGVARAINDDPQAAVEMLEDKTEGGKYRHFKNLSEADRLSALRSAKNARATMHAENAQALGERIFAGGVEALGVDKDIADWVEQKKILPSQGNTLLRLAKGDISPQEQAAAGAQLWDAANSLERSDPEYIQKSMAIRAELHGLDPAIKAPVLVALNGKDSAETAQLVRTAFSLLSRDYYAATDRWTKTELDALRRSERKAKGNPNPGDFKDPERGEAASANLFRYQQALSEWIHAHPDATADEVLRYRSSLTATDTQADLGSDIVDDLTGATP